jgi:hypothetical protein
MITYDVVNSGGTTLTTATVPFYTKRIDTTIGAILNQASVINSWYNGLVVSLRKPMSHDIEFVINYTYSKALDNGQTAGTNGTFFGTDAILDPYNLKRDYSRSDLDQRHRFVGTVVWQPRYAKGASSAAVRQLANGWTASAIISSGTGQPYAANISTSRITPDPTGVPPAMLPLAGDGGMTGAEISTFASPTGGRASWLSRNPSTLPTLTSVDFRVGRGFTFHERFRLDFTADAFNLFNKTLVSSVSTNAFSYTAGGNSATCTLALHPNGCFLATSTYGSVSTTTSNLFGARQLQFGAKFNF